MRTEASLVLKLCWGVYFLLASLYCFLSFIPYTYLFVIVNPPYGWLASFSHFNLILQWLAVAAVLGHRLLLGIRLRSDSFSYGQVVFALVATFLNPIGHMQCNRTAFVWSVAFLLPLLVQGVGDLRGRKHHGKGENPYTSVAYSDAALIGFLAGLVSIVAPRLHDEINAVFLQVQRFDLEMMFWVIVEHIALAIAVASVINLIRPLLYRFTQNAFLVGPVSVGLVGATCLMMACVAFLQDNFGFRGPVSWAYSILFASSVVVFAQSFVPLTRTATNPSGIRPWIPNALSAFLIGLAIYGSFKIDRSDDWNGIVHQSFTLLIWIVLAISVCRMRKSQVRYRVASILAITFLACLIYEGLTYSQPVWAKDVGADQAQIHNGMRNYSAQNISFGMVDKILGNQPSAPCDSACRTLRQYSNIPNAKIVRDLDLADGSPGTSGLKPNVFIFVMDSLRPDYLGIYNPRVDFTPNIDQFGHESVVMRRAFADYAGTSLSEPSIWAGTLLLHAHYAQPFQKVNSLEKLARLDGYQLVISYDEILRQIIPPSDDIIKLDMDKKLWGEVELSSTVKQLESVLDQRSFEDKPVFFYTQSMNVHVNASNDLPKRTAENWQSRPGLDDRIAYAIHQADGPFGGFMAYLKSRNLYENSIIVLTADHGDATGELGRMGHSSIIYPEVMRIPMIVHLPKRMRDEFVYNDQRISALIDIAPSLYSLLGHGPLKTSPLTGLPMFLHSKEELGQSIHKDLFFASDSHAAYGLLLDDGRYLYATYDSPSNSMLFDLQQDPLAQQNILAPEIKKEYDQTILHYLQAIADFYGYHPTGG